jgi:O-acetylserine/cysteine efflux transporter
VLGGALSAAGYTIVARGIDAAADSLATTAHQFTVATLAMLPVAVVTWAGGDEPPPMEVPARFWLVAATVGVLGFGLSFLLYNYAIVFVAAAPSAVVINLIPAFGFVGAVVLLGEALTLGRTVGAVLITGSVLLFAWLERPAAQLTMISELSRSSSELVPT